MQEEAKEKEGKGSSNSLKSHKTVLSPTDTHSKSWQANLGMAANLGSDLLVREDADEQRTTERLELSGPYKLSKLTNQRSFPGQRPTLKRNV